MKKAWKICNPFNPNRSLDELDTPCPFLIGEMRLSGILPASVRILLLATPRRSPLRLRLGQKHAPKSDDQFESIGGNCHAIDFE